jgi:GT2 family glycosyltransferase
VVIVTHNSAEFIQPCLDSLARCTSYPNYEVIAVDNDSEDGTARLLAERAADDPRIRLVLDGHSASFAAANNLGFAQARGEYFILLNADTMVTPGWIERLLRHSRRDPSIGLIVPVTNSAGNEVKINVPYTNSAEMEVFAFELARRNPGMVQDIASAPLFCALLPRRVWEEVGGLDERFEVGLFEDDDLTLRVLRAGRRVVAAEDCFVHHFGQGSFSKLPRADYERILERNRRRFEKKWGVAWTPHRHRSGVRREGGRFTPAEFVKPAEAEIHKG